MHNWDDLRLFLAVARHSTYQGASAYLGLDPTTIARRISRLETALKATLLARGPSGLALTTAGRRLLEAASQMELANEQIAGTASFQAGRVRISTSEGFGGTILAPAVPKLVAQRPAVEIEIVANPGYLSPAIREVDLAITLSPPQDKRLAVERLTEYRLGLYAASGYLAKRGMPKTVANLKEYPIVGYIDDLIYASELRYLDEVHPDLKPSISSSSIHAQMQIVAANGGIAVLPCFMADVAEAKLVRVLPRKVEISRTFWMSARRDVQQTARVRQVRRWVRATVSEKRSLLVPAPSH